LAHKLAILHDRIIADCVEVSEFPDMIQRYNVSGVPKIVVNDTIDFVGAQPAEVFIQAVRQAGA